MREYLDTLQMVYEHGVLTPSRNQNTLSLFGLATRYMNVGQNFPLLTTKKVAFKTIVGELLGFLRGYDDLEQFHKLGCTRIWDANANSDIWKKNPNYEPGYLGRIYGVQWREWYKPTFDANGEVNGAITVDQVKDCISKLRRDPHSRRNLVIAWNPAELDEMCLPPCHVLWQVKVDTSGRLHLLFYQRSCDLFLGVPFNIASYSLLMLILCHLTGHRPGNLTHFMGDAHIYESHFPAVTTQLERDPGDPCRVTIKDRKQKTAEDFEPEDFVLENYEPQPSIKAEMIL